VFYPHRSAILGEESGTFEHLLVLSGRCRVKAGRRRRLLAPGDAFTHSAGGGLSIENLQDEHLELIEVALNRK
jgi:mannose-6-phosphate isomerase-like protein (cupin superfamily)